MAKIVGHVDVDIDQYQAPADGRREDYICKFKVYGQFSYQLPEFRKSTMPRWRRESDAKATWQTSVVDGTTFEFSINSRDCPFLLKPGQSTRVRSIPFHFHMPTPSLPSSYISTHGRAKLEYVVSATTIGRRGAKHTTSNSFQLLPPPTTTTFQLGHHNFNVDVEKGGITAEITASVRNIITISYPVHLLQNSLQTMSIVFPDNRFKLEDTNLKINSKLSMHAFKSSFVIEEDSTDIPCVIAGDSNHTYTLSLRNPSEVTESFTLTSKRNTVKKSEALQLKISYSVRKPKSVLDCTSSFEFPIVVIGVAPTELFSDVEDDVPGPSIEEHRPVASETLFLPIQIHALDGFAQSDSSISVVQPETPVESEIQEIIKRSPVKALRGILKKPRRYSKDAKLPENQSTLATADESGDVHSAVQVMVPNAPGRHFDEDHTQPNPSTELRTRVPKNVDRSSYTIQRGSLQMAAFDRILFARRGAELRDEYMRGLGEG